MWEYNDVSQHSDLAGTVTQFEHVIMCDVKYKYRVAAINHCGRGEFSATVELLCGKSHLLSCHRDSTH